MGLYLFMWWCPFLLFHANSLNTSLQFSCHEAERSALLQFKLGFIVDKSTCRNEGDYPKTSSWDSAGGIGSNCCSWDGVECDAKTGHVIGLDLSGGCIYGSIESNSTLFHLVHLRKLSLAYNHFNRSLIPTSIGKLSELTYLDLSSSFFFGVIPHEISWLSKLSCLDLSWNYDEDTGENSLSLRSTNLRSLVQNLTHLETLWLHSVNILSKIPDFLANLSSLVDLNLAYTGLNGAIPSSLGKLTQLSYLDLHRNHLSGDIPSSLQNLTQLIDLNIYDNQISGPISSWLGNLTELRVIGLHMNELHGSIPQSLSKLSHLESLNVNDNNLDGSLEFDMFFKMRRLAYLSLGDNKLSLIFGERNIINGTTLPKFKFLILSSLNIKEFPEFLQHQNELLWLDLAKNSIHGPLPKWMSNTSVQNPVLVNMSNMLTTLPWAQLQVLDLHSNMIQGQLPIPPLSTKYLDVSNNTLQGDISPLICNLSSIMILDLSDNNFSGTVPRCLRNSSSSLLALNLRNNSFHGVIGPLAFEKESNLRMIDLSHNRFRGKLPRSLATCVMLEYLDFSNNQFTSVFPSWLGNLPRLEVLTLQKNRFHGVIRRPKNTSNFPNLRIIDLSYNHFIGDLPSEYIFTWNGTKAFEMRYMTYMNEMLSVKLDEVNTVYNLYYTYPLSITVKGVTTNYEKIRDEFVVIDLSSNEFCGGITDFVGNLKFVRSLNLSNNMLTGHIPLSVGNLSQLESLDLSHNLLSGEIPQQLSQLNFLQSFNVSDNNLTGRIPQGSQLRTFDLSSFEGNPGLCGDQLPKKCEGSKALPLSPSASDEEDDSRAPTALDWKFVLAGAISGFVIGVALGDMVTTERQGWFIKAFQRFHRE